MSSLFNDEVVEDTYLGKDGVLEHVKKGTVIIELSSIKPEIAQKIYKHAKKKGVFVLDAAVSGSTPTLEKGELLIFVGGDKNIYEKYRKLLSAFSKMSFYMGVSGKGEAMKLVANILLGIEMAALAEAVKLGQTLGLEKNKVIDVLGNTAVIAPGLKGKLDNIRRDEYPTQFKTSLMKKDLANIIEETKIHSLKLLLANAADKVFAEAIKEYADQDFSTVFKVIK